MSVLMDQLRPASFRGVPFGVVDVGGGFGRRGVVHEYPQRDKPFVQDMGRATREFEINGFVVGVDYIAKANRLIGALETAGPGTLVHPWFGNLKVSLTGLGRVVFNSALGHAQISFSCIESGDLSFPSITEATQTQSRIAADKLNSSALETFAKKFSVDGYPSFVSTSAIGKISSAAGVLKDAGKLINNALHYVDRVNDFLSETSMLMHDPRSLGEKMLDFIGVHNYANTTQNWLSITRSLTQAGNHPNLAPWQQRGNTPARAAEEKNNSAINELFRTGLIVQAVGTASLADVSVYDDAQLMLRDLALLIDNEMLLSAENYEALNFTRGKLWADISTRSRNSARLKDYTPSATTSALVLAYELYQDAERAGEITARNKIRRPGFVPARTLKVLSE